MEESNKALEMARNLVERTDCSIFLTGKAGTGKTTFLKNLRTSSRKRMIVTAPTGIAAINAGGVTLHSFFQLDFGPFIPGSQRQNRESQSRRLAFSKEKIKIIRGLDLLVIDEISMVRADMLDAVDAVLRRYRDRTLPFGGVQLLLIGDLRQLPPVVTDAEKHLLAQHYRSPYFFDSHALAQIDYLTLELDKVYRQQDGKFLDLLNAVRDNCLTPEQTRLLNSRFRPGFNPADNEGYIRLTTHNHLAARINRERLDALPGEAYTFNARVEGNFPESSYPVERDLTLKEGAQVMFVKNDTGNPRRFFNGMLGYISAIDDEGVEVTPADGGESIQVEPMEWENVKYEIDGESKEIVEKREGAFRQLPLKTAWAITIHKSQGLTFDRAMIDSSGAFAHGQTYVALSRCRTLEGLVLEAPIPPSAIFNDNTVSSYLNSQKEKLASTPDIDEMERAYRLRLIEGLFNFTPIFNALEGVNRLLLENFMTLYPTLVNGLGEHTEGFRKEIAQVGDRFKVQLERLAASGEQEKLSHRVKDACAYFSDKLAELIEYVKGMPDSHDNKKVQTKLDERLELFHDFAGVRLELLRHFSKEDFDTVSYLDIKAARALSKPGSKKKKRTDTAKSEFSEDNVHPELYDELRAWRKETADRLELPAYAIMPNKTLLAVANYLPNSYDELLMIPGVGKTAVRLYGDALLDHVDRFIATAKDIVLLPFPQKQGKQRKKHAPKGDSGKTSLEMFKAGKSIEEIAAERELKEATIRQHLSREIDPDDAESIARFCDMTRLKAAVDYIRANKDSLPATKSGVREKILPTPEWEEITLALRICGIDCK